MKDTAAFFSGVGALCFLQIASGYSNQIVSRSLSFISDEQQAFGGIDTYRSFSTNQIPDSQPPPSSSGNWLGWGADVYNDRWAGSDATVDSENIGNTTITCIKNFTAGVSASPYVTNGLTYFPTWGGLFIAMNYSSCEILWQTNITEIIYNFHEPIQAARAIAGASRTTPAIENDVIYIGTQLNALVLALNQKTGKLIDAIQLSTNDFAIITMSPTIYNGKLYVGTSSAEEDAADIVPGFVCCSFIGSMNSLQLRNGRLAIIWTQTMIPPGTNFSGAAIWGSQPAIDLYRNQVFVATGNVYSIPIEYQECQNQTANITVIQQGNTTDPCTPRNVYQEAVLAFDLDTGLINWVNQLSPLDAWNLACFPDFPGVNQGTCGTDRPGPDADFGMAPTFVPGSYATPHGIDIIVVGQKNGNIYALSAQAGRVLWATTTSPDGFEGGLIWGIAVDDQSAYFTGVNSARQNWTLPNGTIVSNSVFGAVSLLDGRILWELPSPRNSTSYTPPTIVNDLILTGITGSYAAGEIAPTPPGSLLALNKYTGQIVREVVLDSWFQSGISVVKDKILFGTGYYNPIEGGINGSFQVHTIAGAKADFRLKFDL